MNNPFRKRATEFLRDEEAFLAVVSPEPLSYFLGEYGDTGELYDRLVLIRGTPGSGKTTLARLFEYPALTALLRNTSTHTYRPLAAALAQAGAIAEDRPRILGCRLPLESDYREFWEFPYPEDLKAGLMTALIQARAVLGWFRHLIHSGIAPEGIHIVPRPGAEAAIAAIGGIEGPTALQKARDVEASLYSVISALVPPAIEKLDRAVTGAYRPFDVIDRLRISVGSDESGQTYELQPLVIMDDAHTLHPAQFKAMQRWLMRRELRVARWVLTRLDVLHPGEALAVVIEDRSESVELPGIGKRREITEIFLQSSAKDRRTHRLTFRKMAKDMAGRYLGLMSLFRDRRLTKLEDLLATEIEPLPTSKIQELQKSAEATRREYRISQTRYDGLLATAAAYRPSGKPTAEDVLVAMQKVLMHRYLNRTRKHHGLFDGEADPEPNKEMIADSAVYEAARLHLLHKYDRPFYRGIDDLCDASSENAEQFLQLAAILVDQAAAQLIRQKPASLTSKLQNKMLREVAGEIIASWAFPQSQQVLRLANQMAARCQDVSLEPNAPLGAGANAYGIPQAEFDVLADRFSDLARVLQFGVAYNAFSLVPRSESKDREWCLIELGGVLILHHGLTLKRGGFVESTAKELSEMLAEQPL